MIRLTSPLSAGSPARPHGGLRRSYRVHALLGLIAALPLLLITSTGVLLSCYEELRLWTSGPSVAAPTDPAPLEQVRTAVARLLPGGAVEVLYLPQRPQDSLGVRVREGAARGRVLFLHPQTLQVLGQREAPDWLDLAVQVHRGKAFGWPGQILVCIAGVLVAPLFLLGRRLTPRRRERGSLHARLGAVAGGALAVVALLGSTLNLCLMMAVLRSARPPVPMVTPIARWSLDALARRAQAAHPAALFSVHLPRRDGEPVLLFFRDDTRLVLDPGSGDIVRRERRGDTIRGWLFLLHSGQIFGAVGQKAVGLLGLCGAVLIVTGVRRRVVRRWRERGRSASPPPRPRPPQSSVGTHCSPTQS